jgi:hypothetical protein
MSEEVDIIVENQFIMEKRDINIYHHSTGSAHIISQNSSITLPLREVGKGDYLHISVVIGPGDLEYDCWVDLPSRLDFQFSSTRNITTFVFTHHGNRSLLKIPSGPPTWQLKLTRPTDFTDLSSTCRLNKENVIVGNNGVS